MSPVVRQRSSTISVASKLPSSHGASFAPNVCCLKFSFEELLCRSTRLATSFQVHAGRAIRHVRRVSLSHLDVPKDTWITSARRLLKDRAISTRCRRGWSTLFIASSSSPPSIHPSLHPSRSSVETPFRYSQFPTPSLSHEILSSIFRTRPSVVRRVLSYCGSSHNL